MKTLGTGMLLGHSARLRIRRKLQISGTGNLRITYCCCQLFTGDNLNKKKQHRHLSHQLSPPLAACPSTFRLLKSGKYRTATKNTEMEQHKLNVA